MKRDCRAWFDRRRHLLTPIALTGALLLIAVYRAPQILSTNGIGGAIIVSTPLILAALALTPIALVGRGGADLSIGPLLGFVNVSVVKWLVEPGYATPAVVIAYIIAAAVLYQVAMAAIIIYVRMSPMIVTLSGFFVLTGVNLVILDRPSGLAPEWMLDWGNGTSVLTPVFFILVGMVALWFVFSRTVFYRQIIFTGADERTAFASGVNTVAARFGAHAVAGVYAAVAALTYTALIGSADPNQGTTYTLSAITAVVLGGTSLAGGSGGGLGSILGAISIYLISYVLSTFNFGAVSGFVTQMSTGLVLVISLLVSVVGRRK